MKPTCWSKKLLWSLKQVELAQWILSASKMDICQLSSLFHQQKCKQLGGRIDELSISPAAIDEESRLDKSLA
ncbi:hypothetical protein ACLKA7_006895 [Drosophila subpalustris]